MRVLVTGATGLIGQALLPVLREKGHSIVVISRNAKGARSKLHSSDEIVEGDLTRAPIRDLPEVEAVVHLLGESIANGRWSAERKSLILSSRRDSGIHLWRSLQGHPVRRVLSASAIGFYGHRGDEILTEESAPGLGFLAEVCSAWEKSLFEPPQDLSSLFADVEKVAVRIGLVLAAEGGALQKMSLPFRFGLGAPLGDGRQWMSWIQLADLVQVFAWALEHRDLSGVVNAVSPNPVRNEEFSRVLARSLSGRSWLLPAIPAWVLRLALGEMAELVLNSQRVSPSRLEREGFVFQYAQLDQALSESGIQAPATRDR